MSGGLASAAPSSRHFTALLEIRPDALLDAARLLREGQLLGATIAIVCGGGPTGAHARVLADVFQSEGVIVASITRTSGLDVDAFDLAESLSSLPIDTLVVGVGGGTVLDVAKLAGSLAGLRVVCVPTNLAHDGICSPVASLRTVDGGRFSGPASMPSAVLIDLNIVAAAPRNSVLSGMGDLLSNLTATMDWQLAAVAGRDRIKRSALNIAERAAQTALYGSTEDETRLLTDLAHGLVMSGRAMGLAGSSRPCSGAEHLISHSLDALLQHRAGQHGLQVGLGTLIIAAAHGRYLPDLQMRFAELGLPTHPRMLGISNDEFLEAILRAPATRPDRYTIFDELPTSLSFWGDLMDEAFVEPGILRAS